MEYIDLRSDTVTHPTPAMREAMYRAVVGDDVYGDDPTVNQLQEMAADMLGKEAALFVTSGTMGNLAAILAHCGRGDEAILGDKSHTFLFEAGGISALGGVHSCQLANQPDGTLHLGDIQAAIRSDDEHQPVTRLIVLENTHNRCGGVPLDVNYVQAVTAVARDHNLILHLDGARIFNAAAAHNLNARELAEPAELGHVLPQQGTLCAGWIGAVRLARFHTARPSHPQTARWRDAPGGCPGGCRYRRPGDDGGAPQRRSPPGTAPGARAVFHSGVGA